LENLLSRRKWGVVGDNMSAQSFLHSLLLLTLMHVSLAGRCQLEKPIPGITGKVVGLIMVPGAHLPGDSYLPLLRKIQESYPGPLWVGATSDWLGDMPTPIEVTQQISKCLDAASAAGLSTDDVFMAGHSLGGVVLQSYIATHSTAARAVAFLGTWLPDLYSKDGPIGSNEYVVPVGTFIGELDGGGISYLRREVEETGLLSESDRMLSKTILVPGANHAQVSSGPIPEDVIDNDIDPELTEEEAHQGYAVRVADWICLQALELGIMSADVAVPAVVNFTRYEQETTNFLEPFNLALAREQEGGMAEFVARAQETILDLDDPSMAIVNDEILTNFLVFQSYQPNVEMSVGIVRITTYSYLEYDTDVLDFNQHLSAKTVKSKMKLADAIYQLLGLPERGIILPCSEINKATYEWALSIASPTALDRLEAKGRLLGFGPDRESQWGGGAAWEFSGGLQWSEYSQQSPHTVTLTAAKLTSPPDFPVFSGEHYCDLLSPYRALEWIYIESIRHKMGFA